PRELAPGPGQARPDGADGNAQRLRGARVVQALPDAEGHHLALGRTQRPQRRTRPCDRRGVVHAPYQLIGEVEDMSTGREAREQPRLPAQPAQMIANNIGRDPQQPWLQRTAAVVDPLPRSPRLQEGLGDHLLGGGAIPGQPVPMAVHGRGVLVEELTERRRFAGAQPRAPTQLPPPYLSAEPSEYTKRTPVDTVAHVSSPTPAGQGDQIPSGLGEQGLALGLDLDEPRPVACLTLLEACSQLAHDLFGASDVTLCLPDPLPYGEVGEDVVEPDVDEPGHAIQRDLRGDDADALDVGEFGTQGGKAPVGVRRCGGSFVHSGVFHRATEHATAEPGVVCGPTRGIPQLRSYLLQGLPRAVGGGDSLPDLAVVTGEPAALFGQA